MFGWSINLFRIRGITISLHFTFLLLLAFCCVQGWFESGRNGVEWGAAEFSVIFTSVVLHELGHSFMAMRFGVRVPRIWLSLFGGMAQFDSIPRIPRQELLITFAGPAVNYVIVALLWFLVDFPVGWENLSGPISLQGLGRLALGANLVLGIFNLYPAYPMDGGRILRALLAFKLPYLRATYWALVVGRVAASIAIVAAIYWQSWYAAGLFVFILFAGSAEYRVLKRQEANEERWKEMIRGHVEGVAEVRPSVLEP